MVLFHLPFTFNLSEPVFTDLHNYENIITSTFQNIVSYNTPYLTFNVVYLVLVKEFMKMHYILYSLEVICAITHQSRSIVFHSEGLSYTTVKGSLAKGSVCLPSGQRATSPRSLWAPHSRPDHRGGHCSPLILCNNTRFCRHHILASRVPKHRSLPTHRDSSSQGGGGGGTHPGFGYSLQNGLPELWL